jgi:hypothetical protein
MRGRLHQFHYEMRRQNRIRYTNIRPYCKKFG